MRRHLRRALEQLAAELGPLQVAPLYRTAPVSPHPQPPYLNTAAVGTTNRPPEPILALAKALEAEAGRDFTAPRWSERPLDVDLLVWGSEDRDDPELTLPHPRLRERAFVLVPLADVAPGLPVPPDGRTVADLLADLERRRGRADVERVAPAGWERQPEG